MDQVAFIERTCVTCIATAVLCVATYATSPSSVLAVRMRICCGHSRAQSSPAEHPNLREPIFAWVELNPGVDSEDIASHFAIDDRLASDIVETLLNDGRLDFA